MDAEGQGVKALELGSVCLEITDVLHLPWAQEDGEELAAQVAGTACAKALGWASKGTHGRLLAAL